MNIKNKKVPKEKKLHVRLPEPLFAALLNEAGEESYAPIVRKALREYLIERGYLPATEPASKRQQQVRENF